MPSLPASFTPRFVRQALGHPEPLAPTGPIAPPPFREVVTDSRKVTAGSLFVAIQGDRVDGNAFVDAAISSGATGVLCRKDAAPTPRKGLSIFAVDDTLEAYRKLGGAWRREFSIPMIVVAGAVGKTTTKELLAAALRGRWPEVLRTQGSQNGFVGIPMTLLELRPEHGAAVIEVGIDEIGAMDKHMKLVGANVALLTSIAPEHLEKLVDLPTVAREEGVALQAVASSGGLVAVNLDDPWIRPYFTTLRTSRRLGYTLNPGAKPSADTLVGRYETSGGSSRLVTRGLEESAETYPLPLPGRHNAMNLLAAIAIARGLGLSASEIRAGLATFAPAEGRSELKSLPDGSPVVCDYYNASPASMEAGLELLTEIARVRKAPAKRACLADMLELGPGEEAFHRALAEPILKAGLDQVLLYGERMKWLHQELRARGFGGGLSHHASHDELVAALRATLQPGDAVLIKGSRGMRMETVWKGLQAAS